MYTQYQEKKSDLINLVYGVPQGSILGPLLFIIYVNDLPNALSHTQAILFADDTTLIKSSPHLTELFRIMNTEANNLYEWFKINKLSLNTGKTYYVLFSNRRKPKHQDLYLSIGETRILEKTCTKFLGIIIDQKLDWHAHLAHISNKVSRALYILHKIKHILPRQHLLTVYYSLIHPHIDYGLIVWGRTTKKYLNNIIVLQKKAIRAINRLPYNDHTNDYFLNMRVLKVRDLYEMQIARYFYKLHNARLSTSLKQILTFQRPVFHSYNTRKNTTQYAPSKQLKRIGIPIWDNIPNEIRCQVTFTSFKKQMKSYMLSKYAM